MEIEEKFKIYCDGNDAITPWTANRSQIWDFIEGEIKELKLKLRTEKNFNIPLADASIANMSDLKTVVNLLDRAILILEGLSQYGCKDAIGFLRIKDVFEFKEDRSKYPR